MPEKGIVNFEQEFIVFITAIVYKVTDKCLLSGRAFALYMCWMIDLLEHMFRVIPP